ncbi:MAG: glycerol-3-phosphate acyltransferase [Fibrobacteria bacterium]
MLTWLSTLLLFLSAYAAGCFTTGYYLVRWRRKGMDLREFHSRSAGARNTGRILGRAGFLAAFVGDAGKGAAIIWIARLLSVDARILPWLVPLAVAGHIWPAQLGFRGGKGLVTALGGMLALDIRFGMVGLLLYGLPRLHARGRLLSGIATMIILPWLPFPAWNPFQAAALGVAGAMVLFAHRAHLRNPESRTGEVHPSPNGSGMHPGKAIR